MYLTLTAATVLYGLVDLTIALVLALSIGTLATVVAVRWDSQTVAALGVCGTLVAPALGNALTLGGMGFLFVAGASAAAVLVWRRWPWLAVAASALVAAQVAVWSSDAERTSTLLVVVAGFALLNLAIALGHELRDPSDSLHLSAPVLVASNALVYGGLGYVTLADRGSVAAGLWLVGLAVAHGVLGAVAWPIRRVTEEISLVLLGTALLLGNVAFTVLANGWVLGVGWASSAVVLAVVGRVTRGRRPLLQLTLSGQLTLAIVHLVAIDLEPERLAQADRPAAGAVTVLVAIAAAAFTAARLVVDERSDFRHAMDTLALLALAYLTFASFDGIALLVSWAFLSITLAATARRQSDPVAGLGALGFAALITAHVATSTAPLDSLVYGLDAPVQATIGLLLLAACAAACSQVHVGLVAAPSTALKAVAIGAAMYLASTLIVSAFQPDGQAFETTLVTGVRQQGQALLSGFWSVCGVIALWVGLRKDLSWVRLGGFGLLGLAAAKVFVFDLSTLGSLARVASFIALGMLLLMAAFFYQRTARPATR